MQKNKFFAPEIENISSLPAKISYPNKSSYYSIGKIALYLLSKNAKSRTMDEYKTDLAPLLNTKIYWMILRCLAYNSKNRYLFYILAKIIVDTNTILMLWHQKIFNIILIYYC